MTYADALAEQKRRDKTWEDFADQHSAYPRGDRRRYDELEAMFKIEGCPDNHHTIRLIGSFAIPGVAKDRIIFYPPGTLACSPEIAATFPSLPLSKLEEDCWEVRSIKDTFDW